LTPALAVFHRGMILWSDNLHGPRPADFRPTRRVAPPAPAAPWS